MRLLIFSLLAVSLSVPASAMYGHRHRHNADTECCLVGCLAASLCCLFTARAPRGATVREMSKAGTAIVTSIFVAGTAWNALTAAYDHKSDKDVIAGQENAGADFKTATVFSGISAGLLLIGAVGGLPNLMGPRFATVFALVAVGSSIAGLAASLVGYNKVDKHGGVTTNQEVSRDLSIASLIANVGVALAHPAWLWWRIEHPEASAS